MHNDVAARKQIPIDHRPDNQMPRIVNRLEDQVAAELLHVMRTIDDDPRRIVPVACRRRNTVIRWQIRGIGLIPYTPVELAIRDIVFACFGGVHWSVRWSSTAH